MRRNSSSRAPPGTSRRPRTTRRRWRILEPVEVARVAREFTDEQARVAFLTLVLTGVRQGELVGLRWRDVDLVENVLRVRDSKTEDGVRSIALGSTLAEELWQHLAAALLPGRRRARLLLAARSDRRRRSASRSRRRSPPPGSTTTFDVPRPAAHGNHERRRRVVRDRVMAKAGHANMATKRYLHLAGVVFREEADALERRLLGTGDVERKAWKLRVESSRKPAWLSTLETYTFFTSG